MAFVSRILLKNLFPSPSPALAPFTSPAMSTNSTIAGIVFLDALIALSLSKRASGTATTPTDGSIVQNGKFSAGTAFSVRALKSVDLPTFGRPTIPILRLIILFRY